MIIEINTTAKHIKVKGQCNLNELFTWLMTNFEFEWMNWTISEYPAVSAMESWKGVTLQPGLYQPGSGTGIIPQITTPGHIWVGDDPNGPTTTCLTSSDGTGSTVMNGKVERNDIVSDLVKKKLMT